MIFKTSVLIRWHQGKKFLKKMGYTMTKTPWRWIHLTLRRTKLSFFRWCLFVSGTRLFQHLNSRVLNFHYWPKLKKQYILPLKFHLGDQKGFHSVKYFLHSARGWFSTTRSRQYFKEETSNAVNIYYNFSAQINSKINIDFLKTFSASWIRIKWCGEFFRGI